MTKAKQKPKNAECELVDVLLDFIVVSANLAKRISCAMRSKSEEGGYENGKSKGLECTHSRNTMYCG